MHGTRDNGMFVMRSLLEKLCYAVTTDSMGGLAALRDDERKMFGSTRVVRPSIY